MSIRLSQKLITGKLTNNNSQYITSLFWLNVRHILVSISFISHVLIIWMPSKTVEKRIFYEMKFIPSSSDRTLNCLVLCKQKIKTNCKIKQNLPMNLFLSGFTTRITIWDELRIQILLNEKRHLWGNEISFNFSDYCWSPKTLMWCNHESQGIHIHQV